MTATASPAARGRAKRPRRPVVLLVPVPGNSVIHQLWAGTKLLVVVGVAVLLTFYPGWVSIGLLGAVTVAAVWLAHIPRGALPSVPRWLWLVIGLGFVTAALSGGSPVVSVAGLHVALGGSLHFLRMTALTILLIALGAIVSWTTNVAEIGPALATLGRPFKIFRIPVDEWAAALALALRAFPMLIEEFQVLYAARRLRPKEVPLSRKARRQQQGRDLIDLFATAMVVTLRRADEMGDAITARGGAGQLAASPARPKTADWVALALFAGAGAASVAIETILHITPI
ncbi:energy-coupling factor transporter transmembrane protein EcfT [Mycobacterium sp. Aquia_216]|uniref:energy-coupling factor transporter transmembrane component T family protein n=1 Tax=Mycobacterium sp. Aquia_216 TaxID=2991729 RepID=UPI00227A7EE6|nr:energy-coupling factor transporter transmembrane protein EcfT [Mycobacterium sp. Aquia_216]WAJ43555.1 energy-coupling factor transporter transmembrane protein EcfT [Mycobacterium sp. Aquia_216]